MKFLSRFLIFLGFLTLITGVFVILMNGLPSNGWKEISTYIIFESPARIAWVLAVIFMILGGLFSKKAKKKDRIFY